MAIYGSRNNDENTGEKCPPGLYRAALIGMFDVGNQPGFKPEDSPQHKVVLVWQIDKADSKGRPFQMFDPVAAFLSSPGAKKKSKFAERVEALIGATLTDEQARAGVDDSMLLGRSVQVFVAPPSGDSKWPKIGQVIGLLGNPPLVGITPVTEATWPKHVESFVTKARAKAVGGWKAPRADQPPTPTPPNKSAVAGAQGPSQATREPGDDTDEIARERAQQDDIPY